MLVNAQNIFRKNYQARFTYETYIIYGRRKVRNLNVYYVENRKGEALKGSFREDMLRLATIVDEEYPYEVVERGRNQSKIHYDGFGSSEDEWVSNDILKERTTRK